MLIDLPEVALREPSPSHPLDRGSRAEVRLGRSLIVQVAPSLCRAVAEHVDAGIAVLVLSMPEVDRIDSVGLAALHQVRAFTAARGVALRLVASPAVYRALLDAELLDEFTLTAPDADGPPMTTGSRLEDTTPGQIIAASAHVALRLPTPEDLPHFDGWARDPFLADMVGSYLLYRCRHLGSSHPEVAKLILDNPCSLTVLVEPLGTRGKPVGFLRLYAIHLARALAFLETVMASAAALRRGFGVEASRLLLAYAMDTLGLRRIEAKVFGYNRLSINALIRNNFKQEGVLREACLRDGNRYDIMVFSILEDEMRHQRQREHYPYMGFWGPGAVIRLQTAAAPRLPGHTRPVPSLPVLVS
jgi:RimJ/RimL family protein N-acetyltransferase/anti-anti-sigma regulatory factor